MQSFHSSTDYISRETFHFIHLISQKYEKANQKQFLDGGYSHSQPCNVNDGLQQ